MEIRVPRAAKEDLLEEGEVEEQIWVDTREVKYLPACGSIVYLGLKEISKYRPVHVKRF